MSYLKLIPPTLRFKILLYCKHFLIKHLFQLILFELINIDALGFSLLCLKDSIKIWIFKEFLT